MIQQTKVHLFYMVEHQQCPEFDVAFVTNTSASQEKMAVMHGFNGKGNNSSDQAGVYIRNVW